MNLPLCGDLQRFLSKYLNPKTKIKIIKLSKQIRYICCHTYVKFDFVDYEEYLKIIEV